MGTVQIYDSANEYTNTLSQELSIFGFQCFIVDTISEGYDFTILGDKMTTSTPVPPDVGKIIYVRSHDNPQDRLDSILTGSSAFFVYPVSGQVIADELDRLSYINNIIQPNVLLICNDESRVKFFQRRLEIFFIHVTDSISAINAANDAHIIICDYTGNDWVRLILAIRQITTNPIILLRDRVDIVDRITFAEAGGVTILPKFAKFEFIQDAINMVLRRQKQIINMGVIDQYSGLYTWSSMSMFINHEINRHNRTHNPLCIGIIEIDYFHEVLSIHGEYVCTQVLDKLGGLLNSRLRKLDICCRYNSCKFVVLLPETTRENAKMLLERIRIEWYEIEHHSIVSDFNLTLSGAVIEYNSALTYSHLISQLFKTFDMTKLRGRNRIGAE